jgi:probable HAF family extracellular repeat protein
MFRFPLTATVLLGLHIFSASAFAQKGGKGGGSTPAPSLPAYQLVELPSIASPTDPKNMSPMGLNVRGDIVGTCYMKGFWNAIYCPAGTGTTINLNSKINPTSGWQLGYGNGINSAGVIVGTGSFTVGTKRNWNAAYRLWPSSDASGFWTVESLGAQLGSESAAANAVNQNGVAAGWYTPADGIRRAFIAIPSGPELPLGQLHPLGDSAAKAINSNLNKVEVTGYAGVFVASDLQRRRAFRWSSAAGLQNLGLLGGGDLGRSEGVAINDNGVIVGFSSITRFDHHAFRCVPGAAMEDLGTLGGSNSSASGINQLGHIVGRAQLKSGAWRAFIFTDELKMLDLEELISGYPSTLKGYLKPTAINDWGVISATMEYPDGAESAVALVRVQ